MKRFTAFFTALALLAFTAFPLTAYAAPKPKKIPEFGWNSVKEFTANIVEINAAGNFLLIKEKGKNKKVLTSGALFGKVTESGVQAVTISDLVKNQKTHFWVKKAIGPNKEYQGLIIAQFLGNKVLSTQAPTVQFSATSSQGAESVAGPSISVALSKVFTSEVKVSYTVSGTAGQGNDYTLLNGELKIPAGQTSVALPLSIVNDQTQESEKTVIITLSSPVNADLGTNKIYTYTIQDDDKPGVSFATGTGTGPESTANVSIQVSLTAASTQEVKVDYTVFGTATGGGVDYTFANGTVTIPAGQTSATITATIVEDIVIEPSETIAVTLSNPQGTTLGATTGYIYTITDNDQPTINFAAATSLGTETAGVVNIPVTISPVSIKETKVNYAVTGGTGTTTTDFVLAPGTLTIPAGQTTGNIALTIAHDTTDEVDETVIITLSSPVDGTLGTAVTHTYTIQDNDDPTVQFQAATDNGAENTAGTVNVAVTTSAAPAVQVQAAYTVTGTAASGTDYTLANGTVTIAAGQTSANIPLTIVDDAVVDGVKTVIITLSSPTNSTLGTTTVYTYTINDNET